MTEQKREEIMASVRDGYIEDYDRVTLDNLFKQIEKEHKEIQEYRAIGLTPKMVKDMIESEKLASHAAIFIGAELELYQAIGTVEECRVAREKQEAMKIREIHLDEYYCPACGSENNCDMGLVEHKYCPDCGQKLK